MDWLERFGDQLVGCHLHDVKDGVDHNLPGDGDLSWEKVTASLAKAPIKVIEVRPGPSPDSVGQAAEWLQGLFRAALQKDTADKERDLR
jgi:sugar phosphate isomerase/epimerase